MRADLAAARTWLLATVAGWAVLVLGLALFGMGGRIEPLPMDPAQLAAVLHALESGSPRLFVDNLELLSQRYSFVGQAGSGNSGLTVTFDLSGYLQPAVVAQAPDESGGADAR